MRELRVGDSGADVERWQRVVGATPDGRYGATTERLTRIWEQLVGRPVDGMVDAGDWVESEHEVDEPGAVWLPARHHGGPRVAPVALVVLHCTQGEGSARAVGRWWESPASPHTSAHYVVDAVEVVQCVRESAVAWAAGAKANGLGIHVELVGRYPQTYWPTAKALPVAARLVRHICDRHGLPLVALGPAELRADACGITTHDSVRRAWAQTTHVDPGGPGDSRWPWELFLEMVAAAG